MNRPDGITVSHPRSARRLARERTPSTFAGTSGRSSPAAISFAEIASPPAGPDSRNSTIRR
ncbi:hypothetical protein ACX6XY_04810 [Streptomyces sp. O3]